MSSFSPSSFSIFISASPSSPSLLCLLPQPLLIPHQSSPPPLLSLLSPLPSLFLSLSPPHPPFLFPLHPFHLFALSVSSVHVTSSLPCSDSLCRYSDGRCNNNCICDFGGGVGVGCQGDMGGGCCGNKETLLVRDGGRGRRGGLGVTVSEVEGKNRNALTRSSSLPPPPS